ncbi:MAG: DUF547 domain-containing protein [Terriglobia bacterium]
MASALGIVKRKVPARAGWCALSVSLLLLGGTAGVATPAELFDYGPYARVLEKYVTPNGQVHYAALKKDPADLDTFIHELAAVSPENQPRLFPTPEAQIAYWINAYNAFVVHAVVQAYPVGSVRDLKFGFGLLFFKRAKFVAGGKNYSLDDIEHGILRKRYQEPRIHFAVNCASASCPPLRLEPFRAETLEAQLEQAARDFIARPENAAVQGDALHLSKIFDWYGEDFVRALERDGATKPSVVDYVLRYLPRERAARLRHGKPRVNFFAYDWTLNDAAPPSD